VQALTGDAGGVRTQERASVLAPVHLVTAVDEVADRLLTAIALGEFLPGDRLPVERELCRLLGVSRTTVHEAVGRLRDGGVVDIRRGRAGGAYVRDSWTVESAPAVRRTLGARLPELEQLLDLRARVEELVARTAAERRSTADVRALHDALAAFRDATDPAGEHRGDTLVHDAVLAAAANPWITSLSRDLLTRVSAGFPIEPYRDGVFPQALAEHEELVVAVVDGDVERAGRVAREHFGMSAEALRVTLSRGLSSD
jgi:DNA-binding FadR family transcriptional regulator